MRKKTMWAAVGIAVLLICCVVYFRPMSLSDCIGAENVYMCNFPAKTLYFSAVPS